jgi:hypothetical protein
MPLLAALEMTACGVLPIDQFDRPVPRARRVCVCVCVTCHSQWLFQPLAVPSATPLTGYPFNVGALQGVWIQTRPAWCDLLDIDVVTRRLG